MILIIVLFSYLFISVHGLNGTRFVNAKIDGLTHCRIGFSCWDNECWPGLCYANDCRPGMNRNCCCYQCRPGADYACNRQGKRFCSGYKCVNCRNDNDCSSDGNCNSVCSNGECSVRSNLDCRVTNMTHRCLISVHQCVQCLDNSHCSAPTPFCSNNRCVNCLNDYHCSSNSNCDSICNGNNDCVKRSGLDCTLSDTSNVCLIGKHQCVECLTDTDCNNKYNNSKPFCDSLTNKCESCLNNYQCRSTDDCNASCNTTMIGQNHCYNKEIMTINGTSSDINVCNNLSQLCSIRDGTCNYKCRFYIDCPSASPFCDTDGSCNECFQNSDCKNCGATCLTTYVGFFIKNLCVGGIPCSASINTLHGPFVSLAVLFLLYLIIR